MKLELKYNHKLKIDPKVLYFLLTDVNAYAGWRKVQVSDTSFAITTGLSTQNPLIRIWTNKKQYLILTDIKKTVKHRQSIESFTKILKYNKYKEKWPK